MADMPMHDLNLDLAYYPPEVRKGKYWGCVGGGGEDEG